MVNEKLIKKMAFSLIFISFLFLIFTGIAEFAVRTFSGYLPDGLIVYLHRDLKESIPPVKRRIEDLNPWAKGRQSDSIVGWTYVPNLLYEGINEDEEKYSRTTSSEGFFTPDFANRETEQIVMLGDSFLSTFYVKDPIAWVIRDRLNTPVYNLSCGGWGPESYREAYNKFAVGTKSRIVPVFIFNNDITDVNNWKTWKSSEEESFLAWIWNENPDKNMINTKNGLLDRNSILWNWAKYVWNYTSITKKVEENTVAEQYEFISDNNNQSFKLQFQKGYQFMTLDPEDFLEGGKYWGYMNDFFNSLNRLRNDINKQGGEILLIWIPTKERVYLPLLPQEKYRQYVTNQTGQIDGLERSLMRFAKTNNINYYDLTVDLTEAAKRGKKLYFTVDGHLNSAGNIVVGELVSNEISELLKEDVK